MNFASQLTHIKQKVSTMSDMNFICPTCKRPTHPTDNEIIEHLVKEKDRYLDTLGERTKELYRIRKALEQSEICCTEWEKEALDYKAENIALSSDLELTRKALEIAVNALKFYSDKPGNWLYGEFQGDYNETPSEIADEALNKIKTTLEQKGV